MDLCDRADMQNDIDRENAANEYDKFQDKWRKAGNEGSWHRELKTAHNVMGETEFYEYCNDCYIDPDMLEAAEVGDIDEYMTWIYINIK